MKKLEIIEIDNYLYTLKDKEETLYKINIEFQDIDKKPNTGDVIYISEKLLNKNYNEYSNFYTFGALDSIYGRNINDENSPDLIRIDMKDKSVYLKRVYG